MGDIQRILRPVAVALLLGCFGRSWAAAAASFAYSFSVYAGRPPHSSADGPADAAQFFNPTGIAADLRGNLFIADTGNDTIRLVSAAGIVTTLAGAAGVAGSNDGPGAIARFNAPRGIAVDSIGNVYVADTGNDLIRKITPDGEVTTLAGTAGVAREADGTSLSAEFNNPASVAVDLAGNLYVSDYNPAVSSSVGWGYGLRRITPAGVVTTLSGGSSGVAVDGAGNVYTVVETFASNEILKLAPDGGVTTLAMPNGQSGPYLPGEYPCSVAVDSGGNLFESDGRNGVILKLSAATGAITALASGGAAGIAVDPAGSGALYLTAGAIERIDPDGTVTTVAGVTGSSGDTDGAGRAAQFNFPSGLAADAAGAVYVADTDNSAIRKIAPGGIVSTIAGEGGSVRLNTPDGVAVGADGTVYVADTGNDAIRAISPAGMVSNLAGNPGEAGSADGRGDNARFSRPASLAVDPNGTLYVADTGNHTIRKITAAGDVTTLAGTAGVAGSLDGAGASALFDQPIGIARDAAGNLYVADELNDTIRRIAPDGTVTTLAGLAGSSGSADGAGAAARFWYPFAIAVDARGNVFVGDSDNYTVREITPDGNVTTIAGIVRQRGGSYGIGAATQLGPVLGLAADAEGNLYVADSGNGVVLIGTAAIPSPGGTLAYSGGSRLANLSSRVQVGTGAAAATSGFVISGAAGATDQVLIRAVGPSLSQFGLTGVLSQPLLEVYDSTGSLIAANVGWSTAPVPGNSKVTALVQPATASLMQATGAFALPAGSADSALVLTLPPGAYSAAISGAGGATGLALVEVYELNSTGAAVLSDLSTRAFVGTGANLLLGGFVVSGAQPIQLLIRAIGPTLSAFGVNGVLAQPVLTVFDSSGLVVAADQGWGIAPVAGSSMLNATVQAATPGAMLAAGAFALPTASVDSALILTAPPGSYTIAVGGLGATTGVALVEVYRVSN